MNLTPIEMARRMLGEEVIPSGLCRALDRAEGMIRACGGSLISRQAVAAIIAAWERSHDLEEAMAHHVMADGHGQ
jgi:hypothetical protein